MYHLSLPTSPCSQAGSTLLSSCFHRCSPLHLPVGVDVLTQPEILFCCFSGFLTIGQVSLLTTNDGLHFLLCFYANTQHNILTAMESLFLSAATLKKILNSLRTWLWFVFSNPHSEVDWMRELVDKDLNRRTVAFFPWAMCSINQYHGNLAAQHSASQDFNLRSMCICLYFCTYFTTLLKHVVFVLEKLK